MHARETAGGADGGGQAAWPAGGPHAGAGEPRSRDEAEGAGEPCRRDEAEYAAEPRRVDQTGCVGGPPCAEEVGCVDDVLCVGEAPGETCKDGRSTKIKRELTVGEVARRSGVAVSALRYYESKGLIKSRRSRGNHRLYPREVLRVIAVIKVAQRTGLSLDEIQRYLSTLPDSRVPTRTDWIRLSSAWKAELEARIEQLTRLKEQLDRCIGCGCLSMSDCPLRNPDDRLAAEGPGARLLEPTGTA